MHHNTLSMTPSHPQRGFTLVELAIVLIIVAMLSGGLMMTLSAQMDSIANSETQRRVNDARDALLGLAAANGRVPCPAAPGSGMTGVESIIGGICTNPWDGFLPAVTLGLSPTDINGYATDAWGNPIRYALTTLTDPTSCPGGQHCFAIANGLKALWNAGTSLAYPSGPNLQVCSTASGMSGSGGSAVCAPGATLANNAVAVIFSRGKNGASAPVSADEIANGDADRLFVSHTQTAPGANEFDDIVVWLSPNILYNRMIAAGRLP